VEIGRLSSRVTLLSPATALDSQGQVAASWTTVATLWADIRHASGLAVIRAGADVGLVKASIRMRWRADVLPGWRVVWGDSIYRVGGVLPGPRRKYVDLACELVE
jgi:SPP1 family predicted phage head-tail adaptor